MRSILAILFLLLFATACEKDQFTTKPQLKIKEINSTEISGTQILRFTIQITDKEGDYSPYFAFAKRVINCPASNFTDSTSFTIPPDFINSKNKEGEVVISMDKVKRGGNACPGPGGTFKTDTATYIFWTRDAAGNVSDTARSETIIIQN